MPPLVFLFSMCGPDLFLLQTVPGDSGVFDSRQLRERVMLPGRFTALLERQWKVRSLSLRLPISLASLTSRCPHAAQILDDCSAKSHEGWHHLTGAECRRTWLPQFPFLVFHLEGRATCICGQGKWSTACCRVPLPSLTPNKRRLERVPSRGVTITVQVRIRSVGSLSGGGKRSRHV